MKSIEEYIELAYKAHLFSQYEIKWIMQKTIEVLRKEPNVKYITGGVTLVGDIHGQFMDLLEMFNVGGHIPNTNYLFMGDYVDRGPQSIEVVILLSLLKIKYPNRLHLLRGNHESKQPTTIYGFYMECLRKYNTHYIWQYVLEMFDYLPLAAVVNEKIFCIHGGLSPLIQKIDQIDGLNRFNDIPTEGPIADMMWSDPDSSVEGFKISERGAGYFFGEKIIDRFLYINNIDSIVRAHQLCMEGFNILFEGKVVTVWSAPHYMSKFFNLASVLEVDEFQSKHFNLFEDSERKVSDDEIKKQLLSGNENKYFE